MFQRLSRNALIAGAVAIVFISAALVFGLVVVSGLDERSSPLITVVLGFIGSCVVGLFGIQSAEKARDAADSANEALRNGVLKNKVKEAINEHNEESGGTYHG